MTIQGLLNRVETLNLRSEVPNIIKRDSADIILLNQTQLLHGEDSRTRNFKDYASDSYAKKKYARNPLAGFGIPDLRDTGEFYNDFYLEVTTATFEIDSKNFKTTGLMKKYGFELFGLTKENKKVYATGVFYTKLQKYVSLKTGLVFR